MLIANLQCYLNPALSVLVPVLPDPVLLGS